MTTVKKSTKRSVPIKKLAEKVHTRKAKQDWILASLAIVLIFFGLWNNFARNRNVSNNCDTSGNQISVDLRSDSFNPDHVKLQQCDILHITNTGKEGYILAFGVHERHVEYPGFTMQALQSNQYLDITAYKPGSFTLHDHIRDKAILVLDITYPKQ
jgi:hypothetical protein